MIRRAAVIGSPIAHSLSPALHSAAYEALKLDWTYERHEVAAAELPAFVDGLDKSWVGLSLTMPLKEAVLQLAQEISWTAEVTNSANTLLLAQRQAFNTDVDGVVTALRRAGFAHREGFPATVVGAGATARSAVAAVQQLGAARVDVLARRPERTVDVSRAAESIGIELHVHRWDDLRYLRAPLVVSTVPAGAADTLVPSVASEPGWLLDVVYSPWPTALAGAWQASGGRIVSGLEMLLAQAERQVELMTGLPAPTAAMRAALPTTHV